jgi:choline dehydrogenase-like flavoprotein
LIIHLDDIESRTVLNADLCIIGGGAAGIAIAREFIGSKVRVCLVESGDDFYEDDTQALYQAENIGSPYPAETSRLRFFGGTTNHWGGLCAPMEDKNFETRSWIPFSGWPISKKTLDPYYERAHAVCELGQYIYDRRLLQGSGFAPFPFSINKLFSKYWQLSPPTRFGSVYRAELKKAANVKVLLNANLTAFPIDHENDHVPYMPVKSLGGNEIRIRAKVFILACGGIENARLLLLSNQVPGKGYKNENDLAGRFFIESLWSDEGLLIPRNSLEDFYLYSIDPDTRLTSLVLQNKSGGVDIAGGICLSEEIQEKKKTMGAVVWVAKEEQPSLGVDAIRGIFRSVKERQFSDNLADQILTIMKDFGGVSLHVLHKMLGRIPVTNRLRLRIFSEQAPNPDSRITLSEQRDVLGLRKAKLDWRFSEVDRRTVQTMIETVGIEIGRLNMGRVQLPQWLTDEKDQGRFPSFRPGMHHMGTTRMADDPKKGVVDRNCQVHGVHNLFIAGSSVFPTASESNPTLTIVALAVRLADHLKSHLEKKPEVEVDNF